MQVFAGQEDSLLLYTKADCSNCRAVKQTLRQEGIPFVEKSLEIERNASEMLNKLALSGFKSDIYLPVIYLNSGLCFPAYSLDKKLVNLSIEDVMDTLKLKFRLHQIHLKVQENVSGENTSSTGNSDCEMKASLNYIICNTFDNENLAKNAMNDLIQKGFIYAGYIFYQKKFKVFNKFFYTRNAAEDDLPVVKNSFPDAYILEIEQ